MGTSRIAYVQAVANQVHTRLVPPAAKVGSTTSVGSRRMSGQSKVEESTVAAPANASAPATNSPPVVRRRLVTVSAVVIIVSALDAVHDLYDVQRPSTLSGVTSMETV